MYLQSRDVEKNPFHFRASRTATQHHAGDEKHGVPPTFTYPLVHYIIPDGTYFKNSSASSFIRAKLLVDD